MKNEQVIMLENLLKSGISPILLENVEAEFFENAIVIENDADISLLNGHYEGTDFVAPDWYNKLVNKENPILIINNINTIPLSDQTKFVEILKYKKISTFALPENCIVLVTCSNLKENKLNEEIYSLLAHV